MDKEKEIKFLKEVVRAQENGCLRRYTKPKRFTVG